MERYLGRIEEGLGMEEGNLVRFVGPCSRVPGEGEQETATMLRLFRYEGSGEKVVAERKCYMSFFHETFLLKHFLSLF